MRRLGVAAAAVLVAALALAAILIVVPRRDVLARVDGRPGIRVDGGSTARGRYLYESAARCAACHARDGGGAILIDDAAMTLWSPNLTPANGSVAGRYSDADLERAIRRGLRPDGQRLLLMPSWDYATMRAADVASLIAFLRGLPPVRRTAPAFRLGLRGRIALLAGDLRFDSDRVGDAVTPASPSTPPSAYLARIGGCVRCHDAAPGWDARDAGEFARALRAAHPWTAGLTAADLAALRRYSVPTTTVDSAP